MLDPDIDNAPIFDLFLTEQKLGVYLGFLLSILLLLLRFDT